jgi:hypothetical protein
MGHNNLRLYLIEQEITHRIWLCPPQLAAINQGAFVVFALSAESSLGDRNVRRAGPRAWLRCS